MLKIQGTHVRERGGAKSPLLKIQVQYTCPIRSGEVTEGGGASTLKIQVLLSQEVGRGY